MQRPIKKRISLREEIAPIREANRLYVRGTQDAQHGIRSRTSAAKIAGNSGRVDVADGLETTMIGMGKNQADSAQATSGDWAEYAATQHTQSDTFEKVSKDAITQASQVLTGWAFNTAQNPTLLPRVAIK